MTNSLQVKKLYFVKEGGIPHLSLNEFGEDSRATVIIGNYANKSKSTCYWLTV